ncbi:uncharacterized protein [Procambarus clarkii]|uniref:uncharacterized protein n=1 Tax=Procambarus clarkii TaxID=6728 RepID=UPI001E678056|nr:uncharacterized protein LOC123746053 [Procambarus clarkii]XP_045583198.1 uncharacterized protein LOC123746053 [Procambarus clarkii]
MGKNRNNRGGQNQCKSSQGGQKQTKPPSNRGHPGQSNLESNRPGVQEAFQSPSKRKNAAHKNEPYNYNQAMPSRESHYEASNYQDHAHMKNDKISDSRCNHYNERQGNRNSQQYVNNSQEAEPKKKENDAGNMDCRVCKKCFNSEDRFPRMLTCGHSFCTSCMIKLPRDKPLFCPVCQKEETKYRSVDDVPKNLSLLTVVEEWKQSNSKDNSVTAEGCEPSRSNSFTRNNSSKSSNDNHWYSPPPGPKVPSPHASKCLEAGATVSSFCVSCQAWVCYQCSKIDHGKRECYLTSVDETVSEMKQVKKSRADAVCKTLRESSNEIRNYHEKLETCLIAMHITVDCIKREQKRVEDILQEGKVTEAKVQSVSAGLSGANNLPNMLKVFKTVDDSISASQQWASNTDLTPMDQNSNMLLKELLYTMVQLHSASGGGPNTGVLASTTINSTPVYANLVCEGKRIHVHSLQQLYPTSGTRAVPLKFVKFCIDSTSALTFLDLSWGCSFRGRVYIRLIGNTVRGRQFLKLCTGEMGPSFHNSHFHRVWWKGLPGEHIWGGDYDQGNGSGGTSIMESTENEKSHAFGRKSPVIAGLVAGCYEKEKPSSLFRIYTKDDKSADEEAAFGQVEYGLNVIDAALTQNNINDVVISDCGVVIES